MRCFWAPAGWPVATDCPHSAASPPAPFQLGHGSQLEWLGLTPPAVSRTVFCLRKSARARARWSACCPADGKLKDPEQWMCITLLMAVARKVKLPKISSVYDLQQVGAALLLHQQARARPMHARRAFAAGCAVCASMPLPCTAVAPCNMQALKKLAGVTVDDLMAFELLWTPQVRGAQGNAATEQAWEACLLALAASTRKRALVCALCVLQARRFLVP